MKDRVSVRCMAFAASLVILWPPISTGRATPPVLNGQGQLVMGDRRLFPVGMYEVAIPEITSLPKESFNVVADPYWAQGPQSTPGYMKVARESGFHLIAGLPFEQVRAKDARSIESYVRAVKNDDHLLVWYIFEEPSGSHVTVEQGEFAFQAIRKHDATRPVLFADFQVRTSWRTRTATTSLRTTTIPSVRVRLSTGEIC